MYSHDPLCNIKNETAWYADIYVTNTVREAQCSMLCITSSFNLYHDSTMYEASLSYMLMKKLRTWEA